MSTEIKNLRKTAERILRAIVNKERIILYGDADLDGVASVIILKEAIEDMGGKVAAVYFPDRENEGYGINEDALKELKNKAPALFISLDCGIGNFKEAESAQKMGFELLIIDHHQVLDRLPEASIIVDPKQKDDEYPFKELAAAGIVYKLAKLMLSEAGRWERPERFLELAALASLADMVILKGENEKLVKEGISVLNYTNRPALQVLIELVDFKRSKIDVADAIELRKKIIAPLNSGGTKKHLNEIYLFLTETNFDKARKCAGVLIEKNEEKKKEIKRIFEEVDERQVQDGSSIIFEGDPSWPLILLGPVASRLCQKYKKPTFLFRQGEEESVGAVRTPGGLNSVEAMATCKELLKTYGGHPPAAGFRLKNENLEKFKERLLKYFSSKTDLG